MKTTWTFLVAIFAIMPSYAKPEFEVTSPKELNSLVEHEKLVVALVSSANSKPTVLESTLLNIREDLVDTLNAWVVKVAEDIPDRGLHIKDGSPYIVYYRNQVAVLYDGPDSDEDAMLSYMTLNKEACSHTLNDNNFEHLTQAATGSTTGDWFLYFYRDVDSQLTKALIEALACRLKQRVNVGQIDRDSLGAATGRRFDVRETPSFMLIKQGKVYPFVSPREGEELSADVMYKFALDSHRNVDPRPVPPVSTAFDDAISSAMEFGRELMRPDNRSFVYLVAGIPLTIVGCLVIFCCMKPTGRSDRKRAKRTTGRPNATSQHSHKAKKH